ncbi:hypothetical protein AXI59_11695 [Bacillus nakamurai]|nr:hypothetical protein AXI59_11695 [Bacillus nakamurai]
MKDYITNIHHLTSFLRRTFKSPPFFTAFFPFPACCEPLSSLAGKHMLKAACREASFPQERKKSGTDDLGRINQCKPPPAHGPITLPSCENPIAPKYVPFIPGLALEQSFAKPV